MHKVANHFDAVMNAIISLLVSLFDLVIFLLHTTPKRLTSKHSFYFPHCAWLIDSLDKPFSLSIGAAF